MLSRIGPTVSRFVWVLQRCQPRGDSGRGNRCDRFLACVAYLDGRRPSLIECRGYYSRTVLTAWDWREGRLARRWTFDSDDGAPGNRAYRGQGNHGVTAADVDGDGRDEIVYGACVIDDNGRGLFSTGRGHGDAQHTGDLDPTRPGLETFSIHERPRAEGFEMRDAATGRMLWGSAVGVDIGRGLAADIDPAHPGSECWASGSNDLFDARGNVIAHVKPRSCNFAVWWDGDPLRELLNGNQIGKWNPATGGTDRLLTAEGCAANNGTKSTPCLSADLLGDWREEVVWRTADNRGLRIYSTTTPTPHRLRTLMQDRQYRLAIATQNVAYNQPPTPEFDLNEKLVNEFTAGKYPPGNNDGGEGGNRTHGTPGGAIFKTTLKRGRT